jgi:hypothetical protein
MIAQACKLLVNHHTEILPLTKKFNGIYAEDCSTVRLPNDLIDELPGCGGSGSDKKGAAVKTFSRIELTTGVSFCGKSNVFKHLLSHGKDSPDEQCYRIRPPITRPSGRSCLKSRRRQPLHPTKTENHPPRLAPRHRLRLDE